MENLNWKENGSLFTDQELQANKIPVISMERNEQAKYVSKEFYNICNNDIILAQKIVFNFDSNKNNYVNYSANDIGNIAYFHNFTNDVQYKKICTNILNKFKNMYISDNKVGVIFSPTFDQFKM